MTPESDSILEGITRDSVLQLAKDRGHEVESRKVTIDEWREGAASGDIVGAFACGTAAVITPIGGCSPTASRSCTTAMPRRRTRALAPRGAHRHPVRPRRRPSRLAHAPRRAGGMKIARFSPRRDHPFGIVDEEDDELVVLKADPMFAGFEPTGERVPLAEVKLLAP